MSTFAIQVLNLIGLHSICKDEDKAWHIWVLGRGTSSIWQQCMHEFNRGYMIKPFRNMVARSLEDYSATFNASLETILSIHWCSHTYEAYFVNHWMTFGGSRNNSFDSLSLNAPQFSFTKTNQVQQTKKETRHQYQYIVGYKPSMMETARIFFYRKSVWEQGITSMTSRNMKLHWQYKLIGHKWMLREL